MESFSLARQYPSQRQKFKQLVYHLDIKEAIMRFDELLGALGKRDNMMTVYEMISFLTTWLQMVPSVDSFIQSADDCNEKLKKLILLNLAELYWKCQAAHLALSILDKIPGKKSISLQAGIHLENGNLLIALIRLLKGAYDDEELLEELINLCSSCINANLKGVERFVVLCVLQAYSAKDRFQDLQQSVSSLVNQKQVPEDDSCLEALGWLGQFLIKNKLADEPFGKIMKLYAQVLLALCAKQTEPSLAHSFLEINFVRIMNCAAPSDKKAFLKFLINSNSNAALMESAKAHGFLVEDEKIVRLSTELKSMQRLAQRRLQSTLELNKYDLEEQVVLIPDPEALLNSFEDILAQRNMIIITRGVLDELDFLKLVNPIQRERVQLVLRGIEGAHKSGKVILTSAPMTAHRGLFRYHQELLSVIRQELEAKKEREVVVLTDSAGFKNALSSEGIVVKTLHPRQLPKKR